MFVRSDEPDPLNVFSPEIAGPDSDELATLVVQNTALGMVGETRITPAVVVPVTTDGVASMRTSLAPPPTVARTSNRTPHRADVAQRKPPAQTPTAALSSRTRRMVSLSVSLIGVKFGTGMGKP